LRKPKERKKENQQEEIEINKIIRNYRNKKTRNKKNKRIKNKNKRKLKKLEKQVKIKFKPRNL
jgi:hypothetical protein